MKERDLIVPIVDVKRVSVNRNTAMAVEILTRASQNVSFTQSATETIARLFFNDGIVVNGERFFEGEKDERSKIRIWSIDGMRTKGAERGLILGSFAKTDIPVFASIFTPRGDWFVADEYDEAFRNGQPIVPKDYQALFALSSRYPAIEKLLPLFGNALKSL